MSGESVIDANTHRKMCKKIAQLTKVIYQLNSRTEDHQSIVDSLKRSHRIEVDQLLHDSATKINSFKKLLEGKKQQVCQSSFFCCCWLGSFYC